MKKQGNETKSEMNKKISEIMKTDVYTVSDEANIKEVLQVLVECKTSGLPIVNAKQQVVGFISDGDIMKFIAKQNPRIIDMTSFITVWYDTESFEKKLHDLELTRTIAMQTAPQIRLIQNNDTVMVEKIQTTIVNTIPLWKSQMVLALGIAHSAEAAQAQRQVTDITNELLRKNAETLHMATVETAKESERGIVDLETLQKTNADLIQTLDDVMRIQMEGRQKRQAAEMEMHRMEEELKRKLLEIR